MRQEERTQFGVLLLKTFKALRETLDPEIIDVWWACCRRFELADVRHALSEHIRDPQQGKYAPRPADVIGRIKARSVPDVPRLGYTPTPPAPDVLERLLTLASGTGTRGGEWWTPERVVTAAQAQHILRQAQHFGRYSPAGRFMQQCVDAGVLTPSGQLAERCLREPGDDQDEEQADAPA